MIKILHSYLFLGEAVTQLGCQVYTEDWPREDYYRFEDQVVQPKGRRLFAQLLETLVQDITHELALISDSKPFEYWMQLSSEAFSTVAKDDDLDAVDATVAAAAREGEGEIW